MTNRGFDEAYFRTLYGDVPKQTWFDRSRDDLVVALVGRYAPPSRGGRPALLDIGCGYGYLLARFAGGYELFGVDVATEATRETLGRLRRAGVRVVRADIHRGVPFRRRFDVVLAINVIEHLRDPEAGIRSIAEALEPGGVCVIHLPTINNAISRVVYRTAYAGDPTHVYRPSGDEVRRLFERLGFRCLEDSYAPHRPPRLWKVLRWHPAYLAAFRNQAPQPSRRGM